MEKILILKTLIGSRAHGLAEEGSDWDYRSVYVTPTSEILSLGYKSKGQNLIQGEEDNMTYEIGHFLMLALKCNPSILEVMVAPREIITDGCPVAGIKLQELFPYVWNPRDAFNAFVGYSLDQRKKMLDNHLNRWNKYAVAYIRTLENLKTLLRTGTFSLEVPIESRPGLLAIKHGEVSKGEIINICDRLAEEAANLLPACHHEPGPDKVNDFLLMLRKKYF
jgi:uncharacterized protein